MIHRVITLDGKVLDGRNRYRACIKAGVKPETVKYAGDDPVGYVIAANLHRRHLDESQRAMVAAKLATMRQGGQPANLPVQPTQSQAASMRKVSERSVRSAAIIRNKGTPKLVAAVERGEIAVSVAAKAAELPPEQQDEIAKRSMSRGGSQSTPAFSLHGWPVIWG